MSDKLSSPFFLALPIAIIIILFLPEAFNKYEVITIKAESGYKKNSLEKYFDLDGDGISERIVAYENRKGFPAIQVLRDDDVLVDQWNFTGKYPERSQGFYCCDLDTNGFCEIYILTLSHDSLMLNAIVPFPDRSFKLKNEFVCRIWKYNNEVDFTIGYMNDCDLDNDGIKELIFKVKAGFSKQPRGIYAYNVVTGKCIHTPPLGANMNKIIIEDLNKDNFPEFYCSCSTLGNIHDSSGIPYCDYSSWFMGFDHNLDFIFQPIEFPYYPSVILLNKFKLADDRIYLAASFINKSLDENLVMKFFDSHGNMVGEKPILDANGDSIHNCYILKDIIINGENMLLAKKGQGYCLINDKMKVEEFKYFDENYGFILYEDIDNDGFKEMIFYNNSGLIITRDDFSHAVKIDVAIDPYVIPPISLSLKENGDKSPELFAKIGGKIYYYLYQTNPLYYFKYLIWLAIYAGVVMIVFFVGVIQTRQLRRKLETENLINRLKLKTIKNHISPHFTFNAINSISGMAISGKPEQLHYYTKRFTSLMRRLLEDSDKISTMLEEEVDFTLDYLELQKMRFEGEFEYNINISDEVEMNTLVPRTIIHTFAENAVKYGLRGLGRKGILDIGITISKHDLRIIIEDNGCGRQNADSKNSTGKGFEIIQKVFDLYHQIEGVKINWNIEDLYRDGIATGTKILLDLKIKKRHESI